jgi:hypothetical protein
MTIRLISKGGPLLHLDEDDVVGNQSANPIVIIQPASFCGRLFDDGIMCVARQQQRLLGSCVDWLILVKLSMGYYITI